LKKKRKKNENPKKRHPRWSHLRATEPGYDEFILLWELRIDATGLNAVGSGGR